MNWQRFNKVSSFSGETSGIIKKNFIITAALLSSLFLAAIVNLLYIADNLNNKADARSSLLLQKALTNRQEKIRANLMDNADWGEAYNNLHKGRCEQVPDMRSSYSSGAHPRGTS